MIDVDVVDRGSAENSSSGSTVDFGAI